MNIHDATEEAYKNGYEKGKADAVREMKNMLLERFGSNPDRLFSNYNIIRYISQTAKEVLDNA